MFLWTKCASREVRELDYVITHWTKNNNNENKQRNQQKQTKQSKKQKQQQLLRCDQPGVVFFYFLYTKCTCATCSKNWLCKVWYFLHFVFNPSVSIKKINWNIVNWVSVLIVIHVFFSKQSKSANFKQCIGRVFMFRLCASCFICLFD